jgi:hypothetical protein
MEPMAGVGLHLTVDCILLGKFADVGASIFGRAGGNNRSSIATHAHSGANVGYRSQASRAQTLMTSVAIIAGYARQ